MMHHVKERKGRPKHKKSYNYLFVIWEPERHVIDALGSSAKRHEFYDIVRRFSLKLVGESRVSGPKQPNIRYLKQSGDLL